MMNQCSDLAAASGRFKSLYLTPGNTELLINLVSYSIFIDILFKQLVIFIIFYILSQKSKWRLSNEDPV